MPKRFKKLLDLKVKGRFFPFFLSTLLLSTIYPIFLHSDLGIILLHLLIISALIAGLNLIQFNQTLLLIGGTLGGLSLILTVLLFISQESWLIKFSWNLGLLSFYLLIIGCVLILIKKSKQVTVDTILGAISGYFTLAIAWGMLFHLIEFLAPGSFKLPQGSVVRPDLFIYFSQITMSSVGYGDIIPLTPLARSAAALLGMLGQLYLAVLLGILIGIYLAKKI